MSIKGRKISEGEVSQKIDLVKYLGKAGKNDDIKQSFIQAVIDQMLKRTESSRDVNGKLFKPYSKAYKDSLAFEVFRKTDDVNMTLTGDMMGSLDEISATEDTFTIGITGAFNNIKAFGNIERKRDFFGVTEEELSKIAAAFKPDLEPKTKSDEALNKKILKILAPDDEPLDE